MIQINPLPGYSDTGGLPTAPTNNIGKLKPLIRLMNVLKVKSFVGWIANPPYMAVSYGAQYHKVLSLRVPVRGRSNLRYFPNITFDETKKCAKQTMHIKHLVRYFN